MAEPGTQRNCSNRSRMLHVNKDVKWSTSKERSGKTRKDGWEKSKTTEMCSQRERQQQKHFEIDPSLESSAQTDTANQLHCLICCQRQQLRHLRACMCIRR